MQEMSSNQRYRHGSAGSFSEDDVSLDDKASSGGDINDGAFSSTDPTVALIHRPKDPRSSAYHKYNIFSRLLFL